MSLNRKQQGFTIVELLIVIVVIGILAALVITTFTGIQQRGRNTERTTDIKALHSQLEAYYAQVGNYPTAGNLNDSAWVATNLRGLDKEALKAPNSDVYTVNDGDGTTTKYGYKVEPAGCDNAAAATTCTKYTLSVGMEGEADLYKKESLNN